MKKLVFACTLAAAFAFVACKSNKPAETVVEAEEIEVVAEAPACDTMQCEKAKLEEGTVECKKACEEKAEAAE